MKSCANRVLAALALFSFFPASRSVLARNWTQTGAPGLSWAAIACSADANKLFAAVNGGGIYCSTNAGSNWTATAAPSLHWTAITSSADGSKLSATVSGGGVYTSTNRGGTWFTNNVPNLNWTSIASTPDGSVLDAVVYTSTIYRSTNSGVNWTTTIAPVADIVSVATSSDGSRIMAGNNVGRLLVSTNAGTSWAFINSLGGYISSLKTTPDGANLLAIAGNGRGVFSSKNAGQTWVLNSLPANSSWLASTISADGTKMVVVAQKGLLYSSIDSGVTWTSNNIGAFFWEDVASSADGNAVFAASSNGGIWGMRTLPTPILRIAPSTNMAFVSWLTPSANFVLQQSPTLNLTHWADITNPVSLNLLNLHEELTAPLAPGNSFFRLKAP
jgi:photosystem II stability/assembly factor-like uncharacterized protein